MTSLAVLGVLSSFGGGGGGPAPPPPVSGIVTVAAAPSAANRFGYSGVPELYGAVDPSPFVMETLAGPQSVTRIFSNLFQTTASFVVELPAPTLYERLTIETAGGPFVVNDLVNAWTGTSYRVVTPFQLWTAADVGLERTVTFDIP